MIPADKKSLAWLYIQGSCWLYKREYKSLWFVSLGAIMSMYLLQRHLHSL